MIKFLDIVQNEWREEYDRDWGLAIVLSTPNDGRCWVGKVLEDDGGYFLVPVNAIRSVKVLKPTSLRVEDISLKLRVNK